MGGFSRCHFKDFGHIKTRINYSYNIRPDGHRTRVVIRQIDPRSSCTLRCTEVCVGLQTAKGIPALAAHFRRREYLSK